MSTIGIELVGKN